ncbi:MAG: mechanosensitive ion channel [Chitinivibrionales bacterium]|nr:mechanosensitive ion channel [Chitinivibrionales bacterium]
MLVSRVIAAVLRRRARRDSAPEFVRVLGSDRWRTPFFALIPALFLAMSLPLLGLADRYYAPTRQILWLWIIANVSWLSIRGVGVFHDFFVGRLDLNAKDNLKARQIATQLRVLEKVMIVVVLIIGVSSGLMLFDKIRQIGVSLLASAGIVGITLGFAAQRTIGHLFAGIQLAITQPIRIDDVVIVEGEWGWIEEITLTYVVVKIWDLRRLVLPVTYFIEKPFQNWTRVSADILGTIYIYADYTVPVARIREKLREIVDGDPNWDGKVCGVQVTDLSSQTVAVRALVSSTDSSKAWNLRCRVREELLTFLQQEYPDCLPQVRLSVLGNEGGENALRLSSDAADGGGEQSA